MRKTNRGGAPIRLSESKLKKIIAESVRRILKEGSGSMTPESFRGELERYFYNTLVKLFTSEVKNYGYNSSSFDDYIADYAENAAYSIVEDAINLLQGNNWDYPSYNLRPLDYVMREQGITNFQELLARDNAVEIFASWFWECFGTYNLKYNFMTDFQAYLEEEEGTVCENNCKKGLNTKGNVPARVNHNDKYPTPDEAKSRGFKKAEYQDFNKPYDIWHKGKESMKVGRDKNPWEKHSGKTGFRTNES